MWYGALALLTIAIAIGVTYAVRVWREIHEQEEPITNEEILDQFREAYANGEMDEAEFRRVTELLTSTGGGPLDQTIVSPAASKPPPQAAVEPRREDLEKTQFG